jgi:predicted RNA-binding Zn-ribbon protein involved in translation (DUF1610 family)
MTDETDADNDGVELTKEDFALNATFTDPDGETVTTRDFRVEDVNLEHSADAIAEVSSGLSPAIEDAKQEFQLTVEVPTKTLTCPNCGHDKDIPVWSFVNIQFNGEMEPLSGDYALGHQCPQCGFPH